jgi:hypothetical protein
MTDTSTYEILGLQEIAELLQVEKRTPHAWQYRKLLPPPDYESINGLKAWKRRTIVAWAKHSGRLPSADKALLAEADKIRGEIPEVRGGRQAKAKNVERLEAAGLV